jgi:hypothetical protein
MQVGIRAKTLEPPGVATALRTRDNFGLGLPGQCAYRVPIHVKAVRRRTSLCGCLVKRTATAPSVIQLLFEEPLGG